MIVWVKRLAILLIWLLVWQLGSMAIDNPILLASPLETSRVLAESVTEYVFWETIGYSLIRITVGFFCAFLSALIFGTLAWKVQPFYSFFTPAMSYLKSVPIVCIIVLLLLWVGALYVSIIAVFLVAFPAFYFSVCEGLRNKDEKLREMLQVFRVGPLKRVLVYHWPSILPFLIATSKLVVGMSWKSGVAAELIGLPLGSIGERIYMAKITLSSADLFAWTLVIVSVSILCERLFLRFLRNSEKWSWMVALSNPFRRKRGEVVCVRPIELRMVSKSFGEEMVIEDFSSTLYCGKRYALQEASGTGKTTLLKLMAGLIQPDTGSIDPIDRISMVFQESRLFDNHTALENLSVVAARECSRAELEALLLTILPGDCLHKQVAELSGGMRRRVELCRALAAPYQVLLLDEPFTGLDADNRKRAQELIEERLADRILVIATHDPEDREALGAQLLVLHS